MATYNQFTDSPDPKDNSAAYVYTMGESVLGNQVCNIHLVSKLDYQKETQSSRGANGAAQGSHGGALL